MDNLAEGKQEVMVNGKPRHVLGYLQDFLFHPKRATIDQLFQQLQRFDIQVVCRFIENQQVAGFQKQPRLVSHDRQFVDNTVTECWIFEGGGRIGQYIGGYHDFQQLQRFDIQVVCRFIENQQVAGFQKQPRQQQAG
jgi:ATP-binding cassette subfamily F protein uup